MLRLHVVLPHRGCASRPTGLDLAAELGSLDPLPRAGEPASRSSRPRRVVRKGPGASDRRHRAQRPCLDLSTSHPGRGHRTPTRAARIECDCATAPAASSRAPFHDQPRAHRPCRPAPLRVHGPRDDAPVRTDDRRCDADCRRASSGPPGSERARSEARGSSLLARVHRSGSRTTLVRWTARDADGGPRPRRSTTPRRAGVTGRSWPIGWPGSRYVCRVGSLSASATAGCASGISDGFNATTVTSGRLLAEGVPPVVEIVGAPRRGHVRATASLLLQGSAFDDAGRPLTGGHLRWYAGNRLIGRGGLVTVSGLVAGKTTIRLVATDSHGRSSQAVLPLRVDAILARYLVFQAPLSVRAARGAFGSWSHRPRRRRSRSPAGGSLSIPVRAR